MELARTQFGVPMVLEPEYLASPFLDELSGMTYLSYFMKENSPGFHATQRWVNSQLKEKHISNFTVSRPRRVNSSFWFPFIYKSYFLSYNINYTTWYEW